MLKWIQIPMFKFRNRIKSNRDLKINTDTHKLRCKKFWSGTSSRVIKKIWRIFVFKKRKSHTYKKKTRIIFTFLLPFCLDQTSKNKKVTENIIQNSSKVMLPCRRTVWVISLSTLEVTVCEDKIQNKLTIFLKTCKKLTKIHINNMVTKNTKYLNEAYR